MRSSQALTTTSSFTWLAAAALTSLAFTACDPGDVEPEGQEQALAEEELEGRDALQETIDNLKQAGFPDEEIDVDDDGVVIVGGDAVVSLEASREMIGLTRLGHDHEGDDEQFRQYRTTNVISTDIDNICINGAALAADPILSAGLDAAILNYNNQNLSFNMTRIAAPSGAGCDVVINSVLITGGGGGSAGFPVGGLPYRTINIGSLVANYGVSVATHVITHELGHCIGFRHTDFYNRSISCGSGGDEGPSTVGAVHIPNTPTTATYNGSVMNACFNTGSTGIWDAEDIDALHQLYGRDCCTAATGPNGGCGNVPVNECVGAADPFCLNNTWDSICVSEVTSLGCGTCPAPVEHSCCSTGTAGCENNVIEAGVCASDPYCCNTAWDSICVGEVESLGFGLCGSTCCATSGTPGCDTPSVQSCVCATDSYCCSTAWDSLCVNEVETLGCSQCG